MALEDAPETYYVTDYYEKYPLVLVRLSRIDRDALRDLLSVSWRLGAAKAGTEKDANPSRRRNRRLGSRLPLSGVILSRTTAS